MKDIRITVTDTEHERLEAVKDGRTWREALFQEFAAEQDD